MIAIDRDELPPAPGRPRTWWCVVALAVMCALLGADLADRLAPRSAAAPPPRTHTVVMTWTGDNPYTAVIGAMNRAGMAADLPLTVPEGTIVIVIVVGTRAGAEVRCAITLDGVKTVTVSRSGIGAVAECVLPIRDRRTGS